MIENFINAVNTQLNRFFSTIISFFKVIIRSKFNVKLPVAQTKRCYILGNGPSLSTSLLKLSDELNSHENTLFAVNSFACSASFTALKPAYYVLLDPYFCNYNGIETPIESVKKTFDHLINDVKWEMNLLIRATSSKNPFLKKLQELNPHIKISYYNYVVFEGYNSVKFSFYKRNLAMPQCQNVLAASIFLAINTGFKEIFLLGADHSWHEQLSVSNNNEVLTVDQHFYNPKGTAINMKTRGNNDDYGIHSFFNSLGKAFFSYRILAKYAYYREVKIVNSSDKSYIDAFERL